MRQHTATQFQEEESEINITPMLDVTFIMLIFFIVTATFVKEAGIEVNRPDAATAVKQEKANILVAIGPNNDIWIDRRQIDVRSVRPNIDFPKFVDLYLEGRLKIDELVSRTYKLDQINEGFAALRGGQVARGVIVFD